MTKQERLNLKIANKEQIILSYGHELLNIIAKIIALISIIICGTVLYFYKLSVITISTSTLLFLLNIIYYFNIKSYVSASIKGGMLITKNAFNSNKVTSIKSIKSISSTTIFGINYTKLTYKLDGIKYKIRIVKKIDCEQMENEEIIKTVMNAELC